MLMLLFSCAMSEYAIDGDHVAGEILVAVDGAMSRQQRQALVTSFGFTELDYAEPLGVSRIAIGDHPVGAAIDLLLTEDAFLYVEPNYIVTIQGRPNDPKLSSQWGLDRIRTFEAWEHGRGAGAVVAVLDTGVQDGGPDGIHGLRDGNDMVYGQSMYDTHGHGTHVSGTIAQNTDNGVGAAGVAPEVAILPVKVLGDSGSGSLYDIASGITWATDAGADVINMSLGWSGYSQTAQDAVRYANDNGVVLVAASGNDYANQISYPAAYDEVIAVGALSTNDGLASFSNEGQGQELVAPGVSILQEVPSWYYSSWNGTSMASPHVAAVAALVVAQGIADPAVVREILQQSAEDLGSTGYDTRYGYGVVDAAAAVDLARSYDGERGEDPEEEIPDDEEEQQPDEEEPTGTDTTPPEIINPQWSSNCCGELDITWDTNEPATSDIWFVDYGWYTSGDMRTSHHRDFTISTSQMYTFWIASEDDAGNIGWSGPYTVY